MSLDDLIKYLIWIVFFIIAIAGVYFLLGKIGMTGNFIQKINLNQEQKLYRGVTYQMDGSRIKVLSIYNDKIKIMINNKIIIVSKSAPKIFEGFEIEIIGLNRKGRAYAILKINNICKQVWYSGDSKKNLDIVYLGYDFNNLNDFQLNTEIFAKILLDDSTITPYKNRINIWRVEKLEDLGCTINGIGNLNIAKGIPACDTTKIKPVANNCPNDFAYVLWDNYPTNAEKEGYVSWDYEHPVMKALFGKKGALTYVFTPIFGNKKDYIGSAVSKAVNFDNWNINSYSSYIGDYNGKDVFWEMKDDGTKGFNSLSMFNEPQLAIHELGHLIAGLPDYYADTGLKLPFSRGISGGDPDCSEHQCKMCDPSLPFSSVPLCIDKQRMVEQLNQFCDAKITYISNTYPNPWTPGSYDKANPSWDGNVRIDYKVEYPTNSDPCYILMHVYSVDGQEVRVLVTDKPMNANCPTKTSRSPSTPQTFSLSGETCEYYTFVWDGKDNEGREVASGTYFYKITGNPSSSITKKGVIVK